MFVCVAQVGCRMYSKLTRGCKCQSVRQRVGDGDGRLVTASLNTYIMVKRGDEGLLVGTSEGGV